MFNSNVLIGDDVFIMMISEQIGRPWTLSLSGLRLESHIQMDLFTKILKYTVQNNNQGFKMAHSKYSRHSWSRVHEKCKDDILYTSIKYCDDMVWAYFGIFNSFCTKNRGAAVFTDRQQLSPDIWSYSSRISSSSQDWLWNFLQQTQWNIFVGLSQKYFCAVSLQTSCQMEEIEV